jgi:hypothetical protein
MKPEADLFRELLPGWEWKRRAAGNGREEGQRSDIG